MSLADAILAMLNEQESSGYDLAEYFEASVGNFWAATHQQIYRGIAPLKAKGWVKSHVRHGLLAESSPRYKRRSPDCQRCTFILSQR